MARNKDTIMIRGEQLVAAGDVIQTKDKDGIVTCKVLSCFAKPDGSIIANLEILEGPRKGEKIGTTLRAAQPEDTQE